MHHNVSIHHLQMLLHASVVDLFSPVHHINERNDLSKATSYSYVESEIALLRNSAGSTYLCCFKLILEDDFEVAYAAILLSVFWESDQGCHRGI